MLVRKNICCIYGEAVNILLHFDRQWCEAECKGINMSHTKYRTINGKSKEIAKGSYPVHGENRLIIVIIYFNNKVLLREHKRPLRSKYSFCCHILGDGVGGTPSLLGIPHPCQGVLHPWLGVPHPCLGEGIPVLGYPLEKTWDHWKYYGLEMGYPPERTWDQWKYYGMEMGYPSAG